MGSQLLIAVGKEYQNSAVLKNLEYWTVFFKHKDVHRFTRQAPNTKSVIDYTPGKEKKTKIIKDVHVYEKIKVKQFHYRPGVAQRVPGS